MLWVRAAILGGLLALGLTSAALAQAPSDSVDEATVTGRSNLFAPIADRIVSDPLYLPSKGQLYGSTSYSYETTTSSSYTYLGVKRSLSTGANNDVSQSLVYGITRKFSVNLSLDYGWDSSTSTTPSSGAASTSHSNGLDEPTIGLTYRALDQADHHPAALDFSLSYTPDLIGSTSASTNQDGSIAAGRQELSFGVGLGREMRAFTIRASGEAKYLGGRDSVSLSNNNRTHQNAAWTYDVGLASQVRFKSQWSVNAEVKYTFSDDRRSLDQTTGVAWTTTEPGNVVFDASVNYHVIGNRLVASLSYEHDVRGNTANVYLIPTQDTQSRDRSNDTIEFKLQYLLR